MKPHFTTQVKWIKRLGTRDQVLSPSLTVLPPNAQASNDKSGLSEGT